MYLKKETIDELKKSLGGFDTQEELVEKVKAQGSVGMPYGAKLRFTPEQQKCLVKAAYRMCRKSGEPPLKDAKESDIDILMTRFFAKIGGDLVDWLVVGR